MSPQQPARLAAMTARHKLAFPVLWDEGLAVAAAYGLVFELPDDLRQSIAPSASTCRRTIAIRPGDCPMPARFVIGKTGRIVSVDADPDYRVRPEPGGHARGTAQGRRQEVGSGRYRSGWKCVELAG
jgi:peroxiredoxin